MYGRIIDGVWHDTGNQLKYLKAVVDVALESEEYSKEFLANNKNIFHFILTDENENTIETNGLNIVFQEDIIFIFIFLFSERRVLCQI